MTPSLPARRGAGAALVVALAVSVAACGSDSLRARPARTARAGQVVDASATAAPVGRTSHLMLPSGRIDLTLGAPRHQAAAEDVRGAAPLRAPVGAALVGVSWVLQRAAYPDTPNRQLTEPSSIFGTPQAVRLWLVADGRSQEIPGVGDLTTTEDRPGNAVWLAVPEGVQRWQFRLDYDGVVQTVDARTGKVEAGRAAPLYRALPLESRGSCDVRPDDLNGCLTEQAVGYPYVSGAGWAPPGRTWLLLQVTLYDDFGLARHVTVNGVHPRGDIGSIPEAFTPFLVADTASRFTVRGATTTRDLGGKSVHVTIAATLPRSAA